MTFLLLFLLLGCGERRKDDYIAKVGDSYLTKEKFLQMIPESKKMGTIDRNYLNSLISGWVRDEILYKNAQKYHFDRDNNLQYKADQYFQDLVVNEFLKYHFQSNVHFTEQQLRDYYNDNKSIYLRKSKAAKVKHFFTKKYDLARRVKKIMSSRNQKLKNELDTTYNFNVQYIEAGKCIQEINELIFQNRPLTYYGPIVSDFGYHVIEVLERYEEGSYKKFTEVRDDIYKRLVHKTMLENYVTFVDSLKNNTEWNFNQESLNKIAGELWQRN